MHELKVMHRNLSTENLLVNPKTFELKICGFGSAKYIQRGEVTHFTFIYFITIAILITSWQ